jgi:glutamine cyclotransferase
VRTRSALLAVVVVLVAALGSCKASAPERLTVEVVAEYPHDDKAFTQGLLLHGGRLYESTGLVGRSSLREVDLASGAVLRQRDIPAPYFAEGLALVGEELLQITYTSGELFRWDRSTFESTGSATYDGEGWGLCYDGTAVWMTDGSADLFKRDPVTFDLLATVPVTDDGDPVVRLNELECVGGAIYANVWLTDDIVRIDPASGRVTARIDASPLRASLGGPLVTDAVLNGIAYQQDGDLFLVTGKLWPTLFAVRFVPATGR